MKALGGFIMKGRMTAALVVACFVILAPLFPPVSLLSGGAVALVTLRAGSRDGLIVMAIAGLGGSVLAWLTLGSLQLVLVSVLLLWFPVWALAAVLRATVSLSLALRLLAALGVVPVLVVFAILGDPGQWWGRVMGEIAPILVEEMGLEISRELLAQYIGQLAPKFTGMLVSQVLALIALSLLIGRWWQGVLYNPGGFGKEFRELRMGQPFAVAVLVLFGLAVFAGLNLLSNIALAVSVVVALFGLAVVHGAAARAKAGRLWLTCVYIVMVLVLHPTLTFLSLLGAADTWLDLRSRLAARAGG